MSSQTKGPPVIRKWSRWTHEAKGNSKAARGICSIAGCESRAQWSRIWPRPRFQTWNKAQALCDYHAFDYLVPRQQKQAARRLGVKTPPRTPRRPGSRAAPEVTVTIEFSVDDAPTAGGRNRRSARAASAASRTPLDPIPVGARIRYVSWPYDGKLGFVTACSGRQYTVLLDNGRTLKPVARKLIELV